MGIILRQKLGTVTAGSLSRKPVGTIYPNGEFTLSFVSTDFVEAHECERDEYLYATKDSEPKSLYPIDLSKVRISHSDDSSSSCLPHQWTKGANGIGSEARRKIRSSCCLMERSFGKERLSFLTLTLPPLKNRGEELLIAQEWSDMVRVFRQRLRRTLQARSLEPFILSVTEIQEKRYGWSGQLSLHLHMVFVGRKDRRSPWAIAPKEFRQMWQDQIERVLGRGIYADALENVQRVKKSAESYLGKYMTKSGKALDKCKENGDEWMLPTSWWGSTKEVKALLKANVRRGGRTGEYLLALADQYWHEQRLQEDIWLLPVTIDRVDGGFLVVGYIGRMRGETLRQSLEWAGIGRNMPES